MSQYRNWNKTISFCEERLDSSAKYSITHDEYRINGLSFKNVGHVMFTPSRSNMSFILFDKNGLLIAAFICEKEKFKRAKVGMAYSLFEIEFEMKFEEKYQWEQ